MRSWRKVRRRSEVQVTFFVAPSGKLVPRLHMLCIFVQFIFGIQTGRWALNRKSACTLKPKT